MNRKGKNRYTVFYVGSSEADEYVEEKVRIAKHNECVNKCVNEYLKNKDMMEKYEKDREKEIENNIPKSFDDLLGHLVNKPEELIKLTLNE